MPFFFGEKTSCFRCGAACFSNKSTAHKEEFFMPSIRKNEIKDCKEKLEGG
ncbi:hypothetical protein CHCC14819_1386 [Bacillus licheniformis]|nr:hypothetical protein CHCC14819_1386 [Bacillus licheniformis]TWN09294.1 hypothetical protein CHCC14561_3626 [Bacillus licheniformis]